MGGTACDGETRSGRITGNGISTNELKKGPMHWQDSARQAQDTRTCAFSFLQP